jgi:hypothetical protein
VFNFKLKEKPRLTRRINCRPQMKHYGQRGTKGYIANDVNMLQNEVKVYFHKFGIKLDILECMR